jgi:hypothetical protein
VDIGGWLMQLCFVPGAETSTAGGLFDVDNIDIWILFQPSIDFIFEAL